MPTINSAPLEARVTLLRAVPYFANLPEQVLMALAAAAIPRRYDRGQIIFLQGEPVAGLYLIAEGEVKIFKMSPQGREQVLAVLGPGATFNEVAVLDGGPNPASAATLSAAELCQLRRPDVRRLAETYPALAWALIESIARRTRQMVDLVEDLSLRTVKARLARLLMAQAMTGQVTGAAQGAAGANSTGGSGAGSGAGSVGASIDRSQMLTQTEMAARLGTVREVVGRALRELAEEGLISIERQRIVVKDREGLAAVAEMDG